MSPLPGHGWQVTLCDPIWHVSSSSGVATSVSALLYPCYSSISERLDRQLLLGRRLFNFCLAHSSITTSFKSGQIAPLPKKANLDAADIKSYYQVTANSDCCL